MKAMVLAAGLGTRLRPLTNDRPKALVEIGERTLLEITLARLRAFGVHEVIVNAHHFAPLILEYLKQKRNFGMRVEVSVEDVLLDTGGGLKKAGWFLAGSERGEEAFILHNVDVLSNIDLHRMVQRHARQKVLATLAVQQRESSRYLLFDESLQLCGRKAGRDRDVEEVRPARELIPLAFSGIHIISTRLLKMLNEEGPFSIVDAYLHLAKAGECILGFRADQYYWRDLGSPASLAAAGRDIEQGRLADNFAKK